MLAVTFAVVAVVQKRDLDHTKTQLSESRRALCLYGFQANYEWTLEDLAKAEGDKRRATKLLECVRSTQ
jgi:hypothetical protein